MASIDANLCSLSAEVRSYLSWTIEWPVMNVIAAQDSSASDPVQSLGAIWSRSVKFLLASDGQGAGRGTDGRIVVKTAETARFGLSQAFLRVTQTDFPNEIKGLDKSTRALGFKTQ